MDDGASDRGMMAADAEVGSRANILSSNVSIEPPIASHDRALDDGSNECQLEIGAIEIDSEAYDPVMCYLSDIFGAATDADVDGCEFDDRIDLFAGLPSSFGDIDGLCREYRHSGNVDALQRAISQYPAVYSSDSSDSSARSRGSPTDLSHADFLFGWLKMELYDMYGNEDDLSTAKRVCSALIVSHSVESSTLDKLRVRFYVVTLFLLLAQQLAPLSSVSATMPFLSRESVIPDGESADEVKSPHLLRAMGEARLLYFEKEGDPFDTDLLEHALLFLRRALDCFQDKDAERATCLCLIARALIRRRECHAGQEEDLQRALLYTREAQELVPLVCPRRARCLLTYAAVLRVMRDAEFVDQAMTVAEACEQYGSTTDRRAGVYLSVLGKAHRDRFGRLGTMSDLDSSVTLLTTALERTKLSAIDYLSVSYELSTSLQTRFRKTGRPEDIDLSITLLLEVYDAASHSSPILSGIAHGLTKSYSARYRRYRRASDLEKAFQYAKEDWQTRCDVIAGVLIADIQHAMFERHFPGHFPDPVWIRVAVRWLREASCYLDTSCDIVGYKITFGRALFTCCKNNLKAEAHEWTECLDLLRQANDQAHISHANGMEAVCAYAEALLYRYERYSMEADLMACKSALEDRLLRTTNTERCTEWTKSATLHALCLARLSETNESLWGTSMEWFQRAASSQSGTAQDRFRAAQIWGETAHESGHTEIALEAFKRAVQLLPEIGSVGLEAELRLQELGPLGSVTRDAAALAIEVRRFEEALEILAAGRSTFWTETVALLGPHSELSEEQPELAGRLRELLGSLRASISKSSELRSEASITEQRRLGEERNRLLEEIRHLEGFRDFMSPMKYPALQAAAAGAPIIILNASKYRCDILVVTSQFPVKHVPLPDTTAQAALQVYKNADAAFAESRHQKDFRPWENALRVMISKVWALLSSAVVDALHELYPTSFPKHVRLCPTGPFALLPIHAGRMPLASLSIHSATTPTSGKAESLMDIASCSYLPSLSALTSSLYRNASRAAADDSFLFVGGKVQAPGRDDLTGIGKEHRTVEQRWPPQRGPLITLLAPEASVERTTEEMQRAGWIHYSGHSHVNRTFPLRSMLVLDDAPLPLSRMAELDFSSCRFAFFSSCSSASETLGFLDETISIGSTIHLLGVPSVIGSLFPISDKATPDLVSFFYENMFNGAGGGTNMSAAEAIRRAALRMREQGRPLSHWVPLVHIGI